jgi:hypothetical protein
LNHLVCDDKWCKNYLNGQNRKKGSEVSLETAEKLKTKRNIVWIVGGQV